MGKKPFPELRLRPKQLCIYFSLVIFEQICSGQTLPSTPIDGLYPRINSLESNDPMYKQLDDAIRIFYRALNRGEPLPQVLFFSYVIGKDEDLYSVAARTNLGFAAVASLNGLTDATSLKEGSVIIIPSAPGLFIPTESRNELDRLMILTRRSSITDNNVISVNLRGKGVFYFVPGGKMSSMELAFFWGVLFRFPISFGGVISSTYGIRQHPITGEERFHSGIDIAAKKGTDVVAARGGSVTAVGRSEELGRYVILKHDGKFSTVYGHLDTVAVVLNQAVSSGTIIATVGSSGQSTGPHLHFEIWNAGDARNPLNLIRGANE